MTIEITGAEASIISAALVAREDEYKKLLRALRDRPARLRDSVQRRIGLAQVLRRKLLVARYGEKRAAEIIAERAQVPDAAELADGEPVRRGGVTCYGTAEEVPYCCGTDCPEWKECNGDKLRGYSARASNWREGLGL